MLILTRNVNETITVGDDTTVTVTKVEDDLIHIVIEKLSKGLSVVTTLTLGVNDSFPVAADVTMFIMGLSGNQIRIGTEAPKHISIHREEVYNRILLERELE